MPAQHARPFWSGSVPKKAANVILQLHGWVPSVPIFTGVFLHPESSAMKGERDEEVWRELDLVPESF